MSLLDNLLANLNAAEKKGHMVAPEDALPGRQQALQISGIHAVTQNSMLEPFPEDSALAMFGLGCFWGAERKFWECNGVIATAVGYSGGFTPNPSYEEVCSGQTGHNEVVLVIYDPNLVSYSDLLKVFWESHNPTQGMRQGNDRGTQYRSGIYTYNEEQARLAKESLKAFEIKLGQAGLPNITTEILEAGEFYYAEEYHQQYLFKNPNGYCGLGGCGVSFD